MSIKERALVIVNSDARTSGTSTNFIYRLNRTVNRIVEIIIDSIEVPYSFYAINSTNNVLTFNNGANSITLTPGNYNGSNLCSEIITQMDAEFPGQSPTAVYSIITSKITIGKSIAFTIDAFDAGDLTPSTLAPLLGFTVDTASATSVTGATVANISGAEYLLVRSTYLTNLLNTKTVYANNTYQNVLMHLPISEGPGNIIIYRPEWAIKTNYKASIKSTDSIDFQLTDKNGNVIDLNGLSWSIQLFLLIE